jgi:NAD-dependent dihydropyrimidine dehydrogenase PreA subunit
MVKRQIVSIDEEKCDGCGLCVPGCEEGAIRIIDGKARLVSDVYCDGLGACLGHCPRGAIGLIEREADAFSEAAVAQHLAASKPALPVFASSGGCPGSQARQLRPQATGRLGAGFGPADGSPAASGLANWPVQLALVPPHAPYLQRADILLVADCVPFAMADFHRRFLNGRPVVIGCPKLDDGRYYVQKLAQIIQTAEIRSVTVLHMEVPCCTGLAQIARAAIDLTGSEVRYEETVVSIGGEVLETSQPLVSLQGG